MAREFPMGFSPTSMKMNWTFNLSLGSQTQALEVGSCRRTKWIGTNEGGKKDDILIIPLDFPDLFFQTQLISLDWAAPFWEPHQWSFSAFVSLIQPIRRPRESPCIFCGIPVAMSQLHDLYGTLDDAIKAGHDEKAIRIAEKSTFLVIWCFLGRFWRPSTPTKWERRGCVAMQGDLPRTSQEVGGGFARNVKWLFLTIARRIHQGTWKRGSSLWTYSGTLCLEEVQSFPCCLLKGTDGRTSLLETQSASGASSFSVFLCVLIFSFMH